MRLYYVPLLFLAVIPMQAQHVIRAELEAGGFGATSTQLPFWLRANQFGAVPLNGPNATLRGGVWRDYRPDSLRSKRQFDWGAGVYGAAFAAGAPVLVEGYGKLRYGRVELWAGRRRDVIGLGDTTLSSGFFIGSGNALPIPKVQLHTPDFVPLRWFRQAIAFKAAYAHGWFAMPDVRGAYLHQKWFYVRIGRPAARWRGYVGLNHQVQWGGKADFLAGTIFSLDGQLPATLRDYRYVIFGTYPEGLVSNRYTIFDGTNRIGNHLGTTDVAVEWRRPRAHWLFYHQRPYEDLTGLLWRNGPDGLTGLRYRNVAPPTRHWQLRGLVLEGLYTLNQSGPTFDIPNSVFKGGDNYFNHGQYRDGWAYQGRTIGTPFLMPRQEFTADQPTLRSSEPFPSNRIWMLYAGAEWLGFGAPGRQGVGFTARLAYSRHYGTFNRPLPEPLGQFSGSVQARVPLGARQKTSVNVALALDRGAVLPNGAGGFLSVLRRW